MPYSYFIAAFFAGVVVAALVAFVVTRPGRQHARSSLALTTLLHLLDRIGEPQELRDTLLEELTIQLGCDGAAFFVCDDVELQTAATRGFSAQQARAVQVVVDSNRNLMAPAHRCKTVAIDHERFAVIGLASHAKAGAIVLNPASALDRDGALSLVDTAGSHALVKLEAMELSTALRVSATQDAVTRTHNQRYFMELFELEYQRSMRYQRALAILLCGVSGKEPSAQAVDASDDVDASGDHRLLRQVAQAFRNNLRQFDVVGRYDADTLMVLLPEANSEIAAAVAERLLNAATETAQAHDPMINIGIATALDPHGSSTMMLDSAITALRRARERNGSHIYISLD